MKNLALLILLTTSSLSSWAIIDETGGMGYSCWHGDIADPLRHYLGTVFEIGACPVYVHPDESTLVKIGNEYFKGSNGVTSSPLQKVFKEHFHGAPECRGIVEPNNM